MIDPDLGRTVPAPDFQSGEAGFQIRENNLICNERALALVRELSSRLGIGIWQRTSSEHLLSLSTGYTVDHELTIAAAA